MFLSFLFTTLFLIILGIVFLLINFLIKKNIFVNGDLLPYKKDLIESYKISLIWIICVSVIISLISRPIPDFLIIDNFLITIVGFLLLFFANIVFILLYLALIFLGGSLLKKDSDSYKKLYSFIEDILSKDSLSNEELNFILENHGLLELNSIISNYKYDEYYKALNLVFDSNKFNYICDNNSCYKFIIK